MSPVLHPSEQPDVYRRRRFVVPHRRRRLAVRLLRPLLTALALVGVPSSLAAWVASSPRFLVTSIDVEGTERVAARWVSEALAGLKGRMARKRPRSPRARPAKPPVRKPAGAEIQVQRGDVDEIMRNPANLFSQARILPKYEGGNMVGLQVNAVKAGSLLEEIGIESGDVITSLNGVVIEDPQDSARVLAELADAAEFTVDVDRTDGTNETLTFEVGE